jgi:hypothetical protein
MAPTCYLSASHSTSIGDIRSPYQSTVSRIDPTMLVCAVVPGVPLFLIAGFATDLGFFADMSTPIVCDHKAMII